MGNFCSKSKDQEGGHVLLHPVGADRREQNALGGSAGERPDPREAAAQAAEQRMKAAQKRGVSSSNPNKGRLAAQLDAQKSAPRAPEPRQEERLVLKERVLDPRILVWVSVISFVTGYTVWEVHQCLTVTRQAAPASIAKAVKSSILVFLALLSLSPVLRTLTAATSSDSIWALSAALFILNALLADYTSLDTASRGRQSLSSVLSINAAISSSVVLASRLTDDISVFALSLFSVQSFALFPMLRRRLQSGPKVVSAVLTAVLLGLSLLLTRPLSPVITWIYLMVFVAVTFLAPAALIWAQKFKDEVRGDWDAAVPKVKPDVTR
ncbi:hypothetical protein EIP91_008896 [Steccherinum ochraceum]|uniref:Phosphatidylinositol N-acetylglucosaminyltransferase subunit C n=1 Tax=Steccherinum ochraceum TaxID=92696 RepID=A0A4R0RX51_9APHY|nr:hypothetical protein EIP91_008896 [Steccherinum ochraceum]